MPTTPDPRRQVLRAGPGALARAFGSAAVIHALRQSAPAPDAAPAGEQGGRQPSFDVFDEGSELLVIGDLPGVAPGELHVYSYATMIVIHVRGSGERYTVPLPRPVAPESLRMSFHNGILSTSSRCALPGGREQRSAAEPLLQPGDLLKQPAAPAALGDRAGLG